MLVSSHNAETVKMKNVIQSVIQSTGLKEKSVGKSFICWMVPYTENAKRAPGICSTKLGNRLGKKGDGS